MSVRSRPGFYLFVAGLVGVLSLLLVPFEEIAPDTGLSPLVLRAVSIIQPMILMVIFVLIGNALAHRVGLQAPLVQAWADGRSGLPVFRRQFGPSVAGAVVVAVILTAYSRVVVPPMLEASEGEAFARFVAHGPPLVTKMLYGGITEELITRWGLVSLLAWVGWRLTRKPMDVPREAFWSAIAIAAVIFAAAHLPLLFVLMAEPPWWAIGAVLLGNALPGVIFGWLFWKHGIEASIVAHALAHVLATAIHHF